MYANDEATMSLWFKTSYDYTYELPFQGYEGVLLTNDTTPANPEIRLIIQVDNTLWFGNHGDDGISTSFTVNDNLYHHVLLI